VLTRILAEKKGWELTRDWMLPYAVDLVSEEVHREMEDAKPSLRMDIKEVTTEFAHSWHIDQIMGLVVEKITPTWSAILNAATESKEAKNKTKTTKSRNHRTVSGYSLHSCSKTHLISRAVSFSMQQFIFCDRSSRVKFRLGSVLQLG
jgi:hypothetical protein